MLSKWVIVFVFLFWLAVGEEEREAGMVIAFGHEFLESMKQNYYHKIFEKLGCIEVNEIKKGKLLMQSLDMTIDLPHIDDFKVYFDEQRKGITVDLESMHFSINGEIKFLKEVIKLKTSFNVKGMFELLSVTLGISKQPKDGYYVPMVEIKNIDVKINKHFWKVTLKNKIFNFLSKPIFAIFKNFGIRKFVKAVKEQVEKEAPGFINQEIYNSVDILMELDPWLLINVGLTGEVNITQDSMYLPLDGTVVTPKQPFNDDHVPTKVKDIDRKSTDHFTITASSYVFKTLADALSLYHYDFDLDISGYQVILNIPKRRKAVYIENTAEGVYFKDDGYTTINGTNIAINSTVEGNLKFYFREGDDEHLAYLVGRLERKSFKVLTYGWELISEDDAMDWVDQLFGPITYVSSEEVDLHPYPIDKDTFASILMHQSSSRFSPESLSFGFQVDN